jgi:hypothetical protein
MGAGGGYPSAEDLVSGGCLAEPLLEPVERAGMGLVAVGGAGVGDDDRAVSQVACTARGGLDGDVGGHADEHESVDAHATENRIQFGAVEPAGPLCSDDRFTGPGGETGSATVMRFSSSRWDSPCSARCRASRQASTATRRSVPGP